MLRRVFGAGMVSVALALAGQALAQTAPSESPYFTEVLRRIIEPIRQGAPLDLSGLVREAGAYGTTDYHDPAGGFIATVGQTDAGLQVALFASADENLTPPLMGSNKGPRRMTRGEMDVLIAAFLRWMAEADGVAPGPSCVDRIAPGQSQDALLYDVAEFQTADGQPVSWEFSVSNMVAQDSRDRLKPIWFAMLTVTVGKAWQC